jgi:hypothetical protein
MADTKAKETAAGATATDEEAQPLGETVPGGRYMVDGRLVDANGNPLSGDDDSDDLSSHTVAELRDIADDEDVDLTGITLKDDIIAAIEKKRRE